MTTPIQNRLLQSLSKSVCLGDSNDMARLWPIVKESLTSINAAPFAFLPAGIPNNVLAFDESGRPMISNVGYATSSGTENGPPTFIAPSADNDWLGFIKGRICRNIKGEHPQVVEVGFLIRGRLNETLDLPAGTPFMWWRDDDGNRVMGSNPTNVSTGGSTPPGTVIVNDGVTNWTVNTASNPFWCKAQHQWEKNSGTPRVSVKLLDGYGGSEVGSAFYVYIRGGNYATNTADKDPNVCKGQTIECKLGADGLVYTTDPTAWGWKIGTVAFFIRDPVTLHGTNGTGEFISGLVIQDNTHNTTANGGSGRDWVTDNGSTAPADTPPFYMAVGGNIDNILRGTGAHGHTGSSSSESTGITVANHPDHQHFVAVTCSAATLDAGSSFVRVVSWFDSHTDNQYSGGVLAYNNGGGHSESAHTALTLSHSVSDPEHDHAISLGNAYQISYYKELQAVERLDNSWEILGV